MAGFMVTREFKFQMQVMLQAPTHYFKNLWQGLDDGQNLESITHKLTKILNYFSIFVYLEGLIPSQNSKHGRM